MHTSLHYSLIFSSIASFLFIHGIVVTDGAVVGPISSSSHSQSVVINRVERCVQYELTGLMVSVFLYWDSIYCPLDSCGRSSMSSAGDSEFRDTCSELSVWSEVHRQQDQLSCILL